MRTLKVLLIATVIFAVSAWFFKTGIKEFRDSKAIAERGLEAEATVTAHHIQVGRRSRTYTVTVKFKTAQGDSVTVDKEVASSTYHAVEIGDPVKVYYLAESPETVSVRYQRDLQYFHLLWGGGALALGLVFLFFGLQKLNPKKRAAEIAKRIDQLCGEKVSYVAANAADFGHLDLPFYDQSQAQLEQAGFGLLGNFEDRGSALIGSMKPPLVRLLAGDNGTTSAILCHLKPIALLTGLRLIALETEFSDGTFVETNNMAGGSPFTSPPELDTEKMSVETKLPTLLDRHRQRVQTHMSGRPGVAPVPHRSAAEVIAMLARQSEITTSRRKRLGITNEEFKALAKDVPAEQAGEVLTEAMRLHREKYPAA